MTLLESLIALVILGLAGVAVLAALQTYSGATTNAGDWVEAVTLAESAMEQSKLGIGFADPGPMETSGSMLREVSVRPHPDLPGLDELTVRVSFPDGDFVLHRLVRAP